MMSNMEIEIPATIPKRKLGDNTDQCETDANGSAEEQIDADSKRQKLDHVDDQNVSTLSSEPAAKKPYVKRTFTPLEPVDLPEGQPTTVRELHAVAFKEKLPEKVDDVCKLTGCDICSSEFNTVEEASAHYLSAPHKKSISAFVMSIGFKRPSRRIDPASAAQLEPGQDPKHCNICNIKLISEYIAIDHYKGKNHAKKLRQAGGLKKDPSQGKDSQNGNAAKNGNSNKKIISFCPPCQRSFSSVNEYMTHIKSNPHKAMCRRGAPNMFGALTNAPFECYICQVKTTSEADMKSHLEGKTHSRWAAEFSQTHALSYHYETKPPTSLWCEFCQVTCTDISTMTLHLNGKKHTQKMSELEQFDPSQMFQQQLNFANGIFKCEFCQVTCTDGSTLTLHMNGKKHAQTMAKMGMYNPAGVPMMPPPQQQQKKKKTAAQNFAEDIF